MSLAGRESTHQDTPFPEARQSNCWREAGNNIDTNKQQPAAKVSPNHQFQLSIKFQLTANKMLKMLIPAKNMPKSTCKPRPLKEGY
ncbi:MAG: hypothetical protein WAM11_10250 [Cyanobium sp.]